MSYLKMLGLGARGKLSAAGLFSTAVISGSSSAPNLRVMIPTSSSSNAALEGFGGVPAIRPLETLHNALSLRQLDAFLERVAAAPVLLGTPPAPPAAHKQPSPTNSVGWSEPSSLMSSSGELPSALSSAGPSSPNSNYASNSEHKNISDSNWKSGARWDGEAATLCESSLHPLVPHCSVAGSSVSGDVTPVSLASELDFGSNEATAGSITDHDLLSGEGEDDEDTLAADICGSPMQVIRNDLSPQTHSVGPPLRFNDAQPSTSGAQPSTSAAQPSSSAAQPSSSAAQPSTSAAQPSSSAAQPSTSAAQPSSSAAQPSTSAAAEFYGLNLQQTKDTFYKEVPSSSKNFNLEKDEERKVVKCTKDDTQQMVSDIDSFNLQSKENKSKSKRNELLNNGSRRYSDSSAQKSNNAQANSSGSVAGSRFKTTPVAEDLHRPSPSSDSVANAKSEGPTLTKAKNSIIKPGFNISETKQI